MIRGFRAVCVIGLSMLMSCSIQLDLADENQVRREALRTIATFHASLNARSMGTIYDLSDSYLKQAQTREAAERYLVDVVDRFGAYCKTSRIDVSVVRRAPPEVRAVVGVKCEKGDATELFVLRRERGTMLVAAYRVFAGVTTPRTGH